MENLVPRQIDQPTTVQLEEYKQIVAERRFVMTSYMQAIGLYLALSGFALREVVTAEVPLIRCLLASAITFLNGVAVFAAFRFKSMAMHAITREEYIAMRWSIQRPHSLMWGFWAGLLVVGVSQVTVIGIFLFRLR